MWAVWRVLHLPEISIRTIDQQIHGIVLNKKVYTFLSPHYILKRDSSQGIKVIGKDLTLIQGPSSPKVQHQALAVLGPGDSLGSWL